MTLRAKAEAAAMKALKSDLPLGKYEANLVAEFERVAREFAERALRASLAESLPNPDGSGKVEAIRAKIIAAAIAAAEGDE